MNTDDPARESEFWRDHYGLADREADAVDGPPRPDDGNDKVGA